MNQWWGNAGPALQNLDQHYTIIESMSRVTRASPVVCKQWICILVYTGASTPEVPKGRRQLKVLITNQQIIGWKIEVNLRQYLFFLFFWCEVCIVFNRINVIITRRNMVKSYLIDGKSISSNSQYQGTALRAISRFGESWLSYCTWSLFTLPHNWRQRSSLQSMTTILVFLHS